MDKNIRTHCPDCGVEWHSPYEHHVENCKYKDSSYPLKCYCGELIFPNEKHICKKQG